MSSAQHIILTPQSKVLILMKINGPASLLALPNEILNVVFELLNSDSLLCVLTVCRRLHDVGERLLYQNISITENAQAAADSHSIPIPSVTPYRTNICCSTVLLHPYLAPSITKVQLRWSRDRDRPLDCRLAPAVLQQLLAFFQICTHIEYLELHLAGLVSRLDDILSGHSFHLRSFSLMGLTDVPSIQEFLHTQPLLLNLHIGDLHRPLELEHEDLLKLEKFRGDPRIAASVVPKRPVHWLTFCGQDLSEEVLKIFSSNPNSVRWLDLGSLSVTPTQLVLVSKHFSGIEWLRMKLALRHTLHFTFSGLMLLSPLTQVLRAFRSLTWLDLSPTSVDGVRGLQTQSDECSLCATWGSVCPSLRRVKFPTGTDWKMSSEGFWTSH